MAQLVIRGHETRGEEVIELLAMLGGNNAFGHFGNNTAGVYYVDKSYKNHITCSGINKNNLIIFTLEEFLEKFPYKIGDKVTLDNWLCTITEMYWGGNTVIYYVRGHNFLKSAYSKDLQPYKEETMEEKLMPRIDLTGYCKDKYILDLGNYEIKEENGVTYMIHKKPQYPKTYEECCGVLKIPNDERYIDIDVPLGYNKLLSTFTELLICRDAYWKLAGEQMGLSKPWEPDWTKSEYKFCIINMKNKIVYDDSSYISKLLAFPTAEMRDAFYEYFKDLIEECKELL
jgi:hypothetical protein